MHSPLTPAHLAAIDRETAHFDQVLDRLIATTRELDADDSGLPTMAQLTTVLLDHLIDHRKLCAIAAAAILRLARAGQGGAPNA